MSADVLPELPLSDEVLDQIDHALGSHLTFEGPDGEPLDEPRRVGGEFGLAQLLDFLAGHDPNNATLIGYSDGTPPFIGDGIPIYEAHEPTYSEHDLIAALVGEVRRLRGRDGA